MMIAPIIFCTVVVGIAGMEDMKKVGKTGGFALLYFEIVSTIALIVGLIIVIVVKPSGHEYRSRITRRQRDSPIHRPARCKMTEFIMHIIPTTIVDAFAQGKFFRCS